MIDIKSTKHPDILFDDYVTIKEFKIKCLDKGIKRYEKFNRKKVWNKKNRDFWETSIYKKDVYNRIVLVPIPESIELAIANNNKDDEAFFTEAHEGGKNKYLTLIGGNRGEGVDIISNTNDDAHNKAFEKQLIPLIVTKALTRKEIHRKFQADLGGVTPNAQEQRNSIWTGENCESEWVRATTAEYSDLILDKKNGLGKNTKRMKDDEFVASLCAFTRYRLLGKAGGYSKTDEVIDAIYNENTTSLERNKTISMLNFLHKLWGHMPTDDKYTWSLGSYYQSLIISGGIYQDKNYTWFGRNSSKLFLNEFNTWWLKMLDDDKTEYKPCNKKVYFGTMIGGLKNEKILKVVKSLIETFMEDMVAKQILKVDRSEDLATPEQRRKLLVERKQSGGNKIWVRQNGKVEGVMFDENLPEFVLVSLNKLADKLSFPTDHINPKDLGGINEVENMEITTQEYNSWKRKREPNYDKLMINEIEISE